ncbi:HlyD family efflux transporter periplasmic adaptor subunit [Biomaibacter acetigenes]|uniref:HlyD family efflux transporter periplasmic adaptor subunit n=1 Tax=Biomaibacter acetigenes TaxID=2316383 RepID=A0A3G2R966_9FIRM|nr:efflux RND transporter periplasmic adaptor subunit [Biomaibacter acetigenes]AYO31935.1 HlyD family efflux transporter periplasmic adaptor subunit [Biomaibacter acetigenes]
MEAAKEKLSLLKEGASEQEIEIARSQAAQAEAAYNLTVSSAEAQMDAKEKELEMAKTQLEQAVTAMKQASDQLGKTVIKSPVDGIVYVKSLNEGEMASIGVPVVEILDTSDTRLDVYVAESDIGLVKLHQKAKIFIDSFPGKVFEGEVIEISSRAEFTPKNIQTKKERVNTVFKVTIKIADTSGVIKPGMPADVQIKID